MSLRVSSEASREAKLDAFPFQVDALRAIEKLEYAAVLHEPGLGKTKIALDLALSWLEQGVVDSVLVVTKKALVANWLSEVRSHSYLFPLVLSQKRSDNYSALNSPGRLYIAHYEVVKNELSRLQLFLKTRRVGVICDEAQKLKNPASELFKAFEELREGFARRVILSGSPIANRPYDIWALIHFLDGGKSLGTDFAAFKEDLDLTSEVVTDEAARERFERQLETLYERIQPFSVRETKESAQIVLPDKIIQTVAVEPEAEQEEIYGTFRDEAYAAIKKNGLFTFDQIDAVLKRLLRLVQIASNPRLVTEGYDRVPGKMPKLWELLHQARQEGSKVVIWTSFVDNATWLARELRELGVCTVHGRMSIDDRNAALTRFKSDEAVRVLVATPGAAKEGLTLTVANIAIFFDRSFSLDDYLQAQDRIHRISQGRTCFIYNLVMRHTVDEWVEELLTAKHLAARLGQGDIGMAQYRELATYRYQEVLKSVLGTPTRGERE